MSRGSNHAGTGPAHVTATGGAKPSDSGASEVIGYVVVLGIVTATIGLVFLQGPAALQGSTDAEHLKNTQKTFEVLQNNFHHVVQDEVPARGTEVRMSGAHIHTFTTYWINVSTGDPAPEPTFGDLDPGRSLTYEFGGDRILYENGAVIRSSRGGHVVVSEPRWRTDDPDFTLVRTVRTTGASSIAGDHTVLIRGESRFRQRNARDVEQVRVTVESTAPDAWETYLESAGFEGIEVHNDTLAGDPARLDRVTGTLDVGGSFVYTEDIIEVEIT